MVRTVKHQAWFAVVIGGMNAETVFTTNRSAEALYAVRSLADVAPDLTITIYEDSFPVLRVRGRSWRVPTNEVARMKRTA